MADSVEIISDQVADSARTPGVRDHLRDVTGSRHRELDRSLERHQVFGTLDRYTRFLMVHHRVRERLFGEQGGCGPTAAWAAVTADHHQALVDDLRLLGVPAVTLDRVPTGVAPLSNVQPAWGLLYVTEGSRLGGAVLGRQVEAALGPLVPSSFLAIDRHRPSRWSRVCLDLERSADPRLAAAAASAAFDTYLEGFGREFGSPTECTRG